MVSERVPSYGLRRPVDLLNMLTGQVLELENPDLFKWFTQQVGDPTGLDPLELVDWLGTSHVSWRINL